MPVRPAGRPGTAPQRQRDWVAGTPAASEGCEPPPLTAPQGGSASRGAEPAAGADQRINGAAIRGAGRCGKAINPQFPWKPHPGKGQEPPSPPAETPPSPSPTLVPWQGVPEGPQHSALRQGGVGRGTTGTTTAVLPAKPCGCSRLDEGCWAGASPASPTSSSGSESHTRERASPAPAATAQNLPGHNPAGAGELSPSCAGDGEQNSSAGCSRAEPLPRAPPSAWGPESRRGAGTTRQRQRWNRPGAAPGASRAPGYPAEP